MPQRAIWRGAISFGMVVIPIKLYIATESRDIGFVTLHKDCNTRLRQKRFCPAHGVDVTADEIVRGYEYSKDQYVVMEESDFENLPVPSTRQIEITRFIDLSSIDPIYFERSYVLEPDGVGVKPFYLLKKALTDSGRAAVAKVSIRQKEHLCCLRPFDKAIAMSTMFYPDEIRGTTELELPEEGTEISDAELAMANMLIDQLAGEFDPRQYHDEYRAVLEQVIEAKLGNAQPVAAAPVQPAGNVIDLMSALKASIESAKADRTNSSQEGAGPEALATAPVPEEPASPIARAG